MRLRGPTSYEGMADARISIVGTMQETSASLVIFRRAVPGSVVRSTFLCSVSISPLIETRMQTSWLLSLRVTRRRRRSRPTTLPSRTAVTDGHVCGVAPVSPVPSFRRVSEMSYQHLPVGSNGGCVRRIPLVPRSVRLSARKWVKYTK